MQYGLDLNHPIEYLGSTYRRFLKNEHHTFRTPDFDVLIIMISGVLRFEENGVPCEVKAGEYYIQEKDKSQTGYSESDCPEYYYIHIKGSFGESEHSLPMRGKVNFSAIESQIQKLDVLQYSHSSLTQRLSALFSVLLTLKNLPLDRNAQTVLGILSDLAENLQNPPSIEELAKKYGFSKNYIIKLFRSALGVTPYEHLKQIRIKKATDLLRLSAGTLEQISVLCGYKDYSRFYRDFKAVTHFSPKKWQMNFC